MAPSSDSCMVKPHPQHCGLPAALGPSVSHPTGGIHLGHTEQVCMLFGQEGAVTDYLHGGRAAYMLPSSYLVTCYRCPMAKQVRPHNLGEQKFERCEEELQIQCWAGQIAPGVSSPPGKCYLCMRDGWGCLPGSVVAQCHSCTPQCCTHPMHTQTAASSQSETFQ